MLAVSILMAASLFTPQDEALPPAWFIFLERGKPTPPDKDAVMKMQIGHIDNFKRLFGLKKLFGAGPLADPSENKRGIVVVRAHSKEELMSYFEPDAYVHNGYMNVNAVPCIVHKPLSTIDISPDGIEEHRIVQIARPSVPLNESDQRAANEYLQRLVDKRVVSAWYTLESGPVAEVLFVRGTDNDRINRKLSLHPPIAGGKAAYTVWPQWLGKGVLK